MTIGFASAVAFDFRLASANAACYRALPFGGRPVVSAITPNSPDDTVLMRAIARRDKSAFEQLYQRHSSVLFALALKILNDRTDAEDVLQDTFVQVWKTAESYDDKRGKPLGWLIMLTRSRAIDRLRSRATRSRVTESSRYEPRSETPLPTQQVSVSETQVIVRRAIEALAPEQRTPIELAYFGGFTQSEIAQRLGEPLGTVKTRMRAAMLRLREELAAVGREGDTR